jgi:hypothetical protein
LQDLLEKLAHASLILAEATILLSLGSDGPRDVDKSRPRSP